jgi:hypothetical protein
VANCESATRAAERLIQLGYRFARDLSVEDRLPPVLGLDESPHEDRGRNVHVPRRTAAHDNAGQRGHFRSLAIGCNQRFRFADRDQLAHILPCGRRNGAIVGLDRGVYLTLPQELEPEVTQLRRLLVVLAGHHPSILLSVMSAVFYSQINGFGVKRQRPPPAFFRISSTVAWVTGW